MLPAVRARECECGEAGRVEMTFTQEPLLRHAGYGAAERRTVVMCPRCLAVRTQAVEAVRPR